MTIKIYAGQEEKNGVYRLSVWDSDELVRKEEFETESELNKEIDSLLKYYKNEKVVLLGDYFDYDDEDEKVDEPPVDEQLKADIRSSYLGLMRNVGVEEAVDYLDGLIHETWDEVKKVEKAMNEIKAMTVVKKLSDRR